MIFTASTATITPSVTDSVTLRCGVYDFSPSFTNSLVGRDVTDVSHETHVTHVTHLTHVTSIVVTRRGGDHVASVTQYVPVRQFLDFASLHVNADVTANGAQLGYICL